MTFKVGGYTTFMPCGSTEIFSCYNTQSPTTRFSGRFSFCNEWTLGLFCTLVSNFTRHNWG